MNSLTVAEYGLALQDAALDDMNLFYLLLHDLFLPQPLLYRILNRHHQSSTPVLKAYLLSLRDILYKIDFAGWTHSNTAAPFEYPRIMIRRATRCNERKVRTHRSVRRLALFAEYAFVGAAENRGVEEEVYLPANLPYFEIICGHYSNAIRTLSTTLVSVPKGVQRRVRCPDVTFIRPRFSLARHNVNTSRCLR